jgi:integrase
MHGPIIRTGKKEVDGWLYEEAVNEFLKAKAANRSPKTIVGYRNILNDQRLRVRFALKPIKTITTKQIREVVEQIGEKEGKVSHANGVLRVLKSFLSWCTQKSMSGIADTPSVAIIVKPLEHNRKLGYVPKVDELGLLFWKMEEVKALPQFKFAASLIALTAQRRTTVLSALNADLTPMEGRHGWGMWRMEPDPLIQSDRPHAVPLPPLAWSIVQSARLFSQGSPYLFPQLKRWRAGDDAKNHMSGNPVADVLKASSLTGELGPHDMRRALATHGPAILGIRDAHTKLILNHATGGDVTTAHYALHESIPDKVAVMERWEGWLIRLMQENAPQGRDWPNFLPRPEAYQVRN